MNASVVAETLARTFAGPLGRYLVEQGGAEGWTKENWTKATVLAHVNGTLRIGFPFDPDRLTFAAFDLDGKKHPEGRAWSLATARRIVRALADLGIRSMLEQSRSGSGFHVWILFDANGPSLRDARELAAALLRKLGLVDDFSERVGVPGFYPWPPKLKGCGRVPYLPLFGACNGTASGLLCDPETGEPFEDQLAALEGAERTSAEVFAAALETLRVLAPEPPKPERPKMQSRTFAGELSAYAESALSGEVARVSSALKDTRHPTLYSAARNLGELVAGGELLRALVESSLYDACMTNGLLEEGREGEVRDTILAGIEKGLLKPRRGDPPRTATSSPEADVPEEPAYIRDDPGASPTGKYIRSDAGNAPGVRTKITLRAELVAVTDEAEAALIGSGDSGIYSRANRLVHFVRATGEGTDADLIIPAKGTPEICMATKTWVREAIDRCAVFVTITKKRGETEEKRVLPPAWAAETLLERNGRKFPRLLAVIETPTMRPDGSILTEPGYDPRTHLLYIPSADFPAIPVRPSELDVAVAIDNINDVLFDFPYQTDEDKAAHFATILAGVGRYAIRGPVPMSAFRSPAAGTGKGLAASVVSLIATGREPASMGPTDNKEEMRKAIISVGLAGWPMVLIDNVDGMLKSPVLDSILTKTEHTDRLLGVLEMKSVPMIAVWMVTGNNITFGGDLPRRILAIDMDASVEFPEDREGFRYLDLRKHVIEDRGQLVASALTILRGYHVAGCPAHGKSRKGSFEAWDDLIRGAVVWATEKDPVATSERVRSESNVDGEVLGGLLKSLVQVIGDESKTAAQIITLAESSPDITSAIKAGTTHGKIDSRSLGYLLKKFQKRISGGLSIRQTGKDRIGTTLWTVEKAKR